MERDREREFAMILTFCAVISTKQFYKIKPRKMDLPANSVLKVSTVVQFITLQTTPGVYIATHKRLETS